MLNLLPKSSLLDKITKIYVVGLKPLQKITLRATLVGDKNEMFESHAQYIADKDGKVDVCRDSSLGGSYSGVEPMGLVWSMKQAPGQEKGVLLRKVDVAKPYNIVLNCFDGHATPNETSPQPMTSGTFQKWYMADGVTRIPVREGRIRGTLFIPAGDGPFPGVIDLMGGGGGLVEFRASLMASRGFAALALAYIGYDDLPENLPTVIDMEYFEEAANWLNSHPKVLSHGIGVQGNCYGAWIALLMVSFNIKGIKAVVAISPPLHAHPSPFKYKGKVSEVTPYEHSKKMKTEVGSIWRYGYPTVTDYNTPGNSKYPHVAPVEHILCPVLVVLGTDDLLVNPDFSVKMIKNGLKKHGRENLCTVLRYPGAGHHFEPPFSPYYYSAYVKNIGKWSGDYHIVFGGDMKYHARAQEDSWPKILTFLRKHLVV